MRSWPVSAQQDVVGEPAEDRAAAARAVDLLGLGALRAQAVGPGGAGADGAERGRGRHEQGEGDEDEQAEAGHPSLDRHPAGAFSPAQRTRTRTRFECQPRSYG